MAEQPAKPNINRIYALDLRDGNRLLALFEQAVKANIWGNSESHRNDFFSLAQHSLRIDNYKSPGKLFRWLIREKDTAKITVLDEDAGRALLKSVLVPYTGLALVAQNANAPKKRHEVEDPEFTQYVLSGDEITYMHPIMAQCFFPQRRLKGDPRYYQTDHGRASLILEAGVLVSRETSHTFKEKSIPHGGFARLLLSYINGEVVRTQSPLIDMGSSLREFLLKHEVTYGGNQGRALIEQLENLAAATITLGLWGDREIHQKSERIVSRTSFWIEKDEGQASFWQPELMLSDGYTKALLESPVPISLTAVISLRNDPRAMDLYTWLAHRLFTVRREIRIPWRTLQPIFGPTIDPKRMNNFKAAFKKSLKLALAQYPDANVIPSRDYLILRPSKPAIPAKPALQIPT